MVNKQNAFKGKSDVNISIVCCLLTPAYGPPIRIDLTWYIQAI